ncbi:MAG: hypothetical protein IPL53_13990 [Ignavibacteria bacterium]|nr:hypothetical protein [Ignavibacteria bacterium]
MVTKKIARRVSESPGFTSKLFGTPTTAGKALMQLMNITKEMADIGVKYYR